MPSLLAPSFGPLPLAGRAPSAEGCEPGPRKKITGVDFFGAMPGVGWFC